MGTRGTLLLRAVIDTKGLTAGLRGLTQTITKENSNISRQMSLYRAGEDKAVKSSFDRQKREQDALFRYQVQTRQKTSADFLKYLREEENAEKTSISRRISLRAESDRIERASIKKTSAFAAAVYSTRINLPGASPLLGRSLSAAGLDLTKRSTLALGTAIAGIGTAAAAAGPAITFLNECTDKASSLNESLNKSQVIFKSSSKEIEAWAENAVKNIGQTKAQAIDAAASFGNLFLAAGLSLSDSAKRSEEIVTRASDLSSLMNVSTADSLRALQSGLQGEAEPLRRFGIFISEARVKAEAFALGLGKVPPNAEKVRQANEAVAIATVKAAEAQKKFGAGSAEAATANLRLEKANTALEKALAGSNSQLTDQEKIQARLSVIMKDSAVAAGDFARTSKEVANAQRQITAEIEDLQAKIGQDFLPYKKDFLAFFKDSLDVVNDLKTQFDLFADSLKNAGPGDALATFLKNLMEAVRAAREILHLNTQTAVAERTDAVRASTAKQDQKFFEGKRKQLDQVYKIRDLDPNDKRIVPMVKDIFSDDLYNRASSYGVDVKRRNNAGEDFAILDHAVASAKNKHDFYQGRVKESHDLAVDQEIDRRIQESLRNSKGTTGTTSPTGNGNTRSGSGNGGGLYSGAERNKAEAAAKREAEKQRRAAEKATREARQAAFKLSQTELRGQVEDFKATLKGASTIKAGYGAEGSLNAVISTARDQSKALKDAENNAALKRFEEARKINPKAAKIGLLEAQAIARQNYDKREAAINEQKQKAFERILKQARTQADIAEKSTREDIQAYEAGREHYRDFLKVEEDELQDAQEQAKRRGEFARSNDLIQSFYDNKRRQITEQYRDDLQNAGGDDNAIAAATRRRDLAAAQAKRESDRAIADNILLGTSADIEYGASASVNRLFRASANGDNNLEALQGTFEELGQTAGNAFADYSARRFVDGPLNKFFDGIAERIAGSGQEAGQGIMQGANFFASAIGLLFQQNNKKKNGGLFGGLLGGLIGFAVGGPAGALTGFSAGSQAGQGNYLGAGLSLLSAFPSGAGALGKGGGKFGGGGVLGGGGPLGGGGKFGAGGLAAYAAGGFPPVGRASLFGDGGGPELMFGEQGRVTLLGLGGHQEYKPSGRSVVLPAESSARLVKAAATIGGAENGSGSSSEKAERERLVVINYNGDIHDRMDVEISEREIKNKRRRESMVN